MSSAAPAFKAALVSVCRTLFPEPAYVSYGHPGTVRRDDMVAVMNVTSEQEIATMSAQRRREETLTVEVVFSYWAGGSDQQAVTERAYAALAELEDYLQDSGTIASLQITVGGTVRDCMVTGHVLEEADDPDLLATGRLADITATVQARVRI